MLAAAESGAPPSPLGEPLVELPLPPVQAQDEMVSAEGVEERFLRTRCLCAVVEEEVQSCAIRPMDGSGAGARNYLPWERAGPEAAVAIHWKTRRRWGVAEGEVCCHVNATGREAVEASAGPTRPRQLSQLQRVQNERAFQHRRKAHEHALVLR